MIFHLYFTQFQMLFKILNSQNIIKKEYVILEVKNRKTNFLISLLIFIQLNFMFIFYQFFNKLSNQSYNNPNPITNLFFSPTLSNWIKNHVFFVINKSQYNIPSPLIFSHFHVISYLTVFCIPTKHSTWLKLASAAIFAYEVLCMNLYYCF